MNDQVKNVKRYNCLKWRVMIVQIEHIYEETILKKATLFKMNKVSIWIDTTIQHEKS